MYAIIQIGSGQYKVSKGEVISVDRLAQDPGKTINLERIILVSDGKSKFDIGKPFLKGIKISAEVLRHFDGRKKIAFKYQRRKHYFKKHGHRQLLTELRVKEISEK